MIAFCARHPTAANLLMMGFLALGLFTLPNLRRDTFPRIQPSKMEVSVAYPGARAEDVEEAICLRIEDAIDAVNQIFRVSCEAREGLAKATVEMVEGGNLDRFSADIKTEIDAVTDFPERAETPIVRQLGLTDFVAAVAVTGFSDPTALKTYAEELKSRMLQKPLITKVEITGFSDRQIRIDLKEAALKQLGMGAADVARKIERQSVELPAGSLLTSERDVLVRFADERKSAISFNDIVIASEPSGGQVRLRDIASITDRFELDENKTLYNGQRAAILKVSKALNEDTLRAIDSLRAFLDQERKSSPPGVSLAITNDGSSIVRDRLNLLTKNSAQGLALVFLSMWLFFGFRYSFWVALGLPVSFAGGFAIMYAIDYSINMLTMVGLLIAIGILMDDAIVISENVAAHRQRGKRGLQAAIDGAREVLPSITASFLTTAFIFGSLAFIKGDIGQVLRVIPVVMLVVLTVSLVEAFLILPNHLAHSINRSHERMGWLQSKVGMGLNKLRDAIGVLVDIAVRFRYLTIGISMAGLMIAFSIMVNGTVKFVAFPEIDGDVLEARILLPQGTPLARTDTVIARVTDVIAKLNKRLTPKQPNGQPLVKAVTVEYGTNPDAHESGPHVATVRADLLGAEVRATPSDELLGLWRSEVGELPDVIAMQFTTPTIGPGGRAIDIQLQGNDLTETKAASVALIDWLKRYRGAFDVSDDLRPGKLEIGVHLKKEATNLGLDAQTIADQLRAAYFGTTVSEIQVGPESVEIDVRLRSEDRDSISDLWSFWVTDSEGRNIPLTAVALLEPERGFARINRVNGIRTVTVRGDVDAGLGNASAIVNDTLERFVPEMRLRYPTVKVALEGQNKEARTTQQSMLAGFTIGLIGVYLLLAFLFGSYLEPLVVMVAIPLALIGVIFGHLLMDLDMSMPSLLGFVSLAGVVVNNSILLVNFAKSRHGDGMTLLRAVGEASRLRFRAILLTTATTVAGLFPLLVETSLQAQVLVPLVTSLAFGLLASTILVLFVVPSLYMALDDFGLTTVAKQDQLPEEPSAFRAPAE
ncbi:MAG: efflux RND transporter permease subunit [Hyphomicrobiaceae bacterium]